MSKVIYSSATVERWASYHSVVSYGPIPIAGELDAMREGLTGLVGILSWARPHGSQAELDFIKLHVLGPLKSLGVPYDVDGFGNVWATVPKPVNAGPDILWSCHVDTVHAKGGRQSVRYGADSQTIELVKRKPGRCLGADDGAGVWLLLEMIRAGVPGGYVFHRGEEKGRLGSTYVADFEPERLTGWDCCIAFDRRDYSDIITHQMGERCASEAFACTFAAAINGAGRAFDYRADDTGSYTDSYSYVDLIPECTNISVGYSGEHGPRETLDGLHVWRLRSALVSADFSGVAVEREPGATDFDLYPGYAGGWQDDAYSSWEPSGSFAFGSPAAGGGGDDTAEGLADLVRRFPGVAAELLESVGITPDDFLEALSPAEFGQAMGAGGRFS